MTVTVCKTLSDHSVTESVQPGTLSDIFTSLGLGNAIALVNGKIAVPETVVTDEDIVFIRQVPKGLVAGLIIAAGVLLVAGAAYAGYEVYKMRKQMEKYKEGLSSFGDSVTNLPNVKGANNVRALDRSIPYIIGKARIAPYVLSEGMINITGLYGQMYRQIPYILGYSNLVLRKCFSNGRDVYTFTGDTPHQGSFLVPDISPDAAITIAQTGVQYTAYPNCMRNTYVTIDAGDQLLKADDPNYTALTYTLPENTAKAWVFLMFNGLRKYSSEGKDVAHSITLRLTYSINGGTTWHPLTSIGGETGDYVVSYNRATQFRKLQSLTLPFSATSTLTEPIRIRIECLSNMTSGALEDVFVQSILALTYDPQASIERNNYSYLPVIDEDVAKKCCIVGLESGARNSEEEDAFRNLAFIVEGMAWTWNGSTWENRAPTRNPASWLFEILTSDVHKQSEIEYSEIDYDSFGELYEYCEEEEIEVNMVILEGEPKEKIIQKICDICYSTLYKNLDGKIAVATDKPKENAIAIINTQNCFSFTNKKDLTQQVDGLRITFINEDTDYEQDSYEVMRPGVTKDANSKIRALTTDGITKYEQVVKYAWRLMAIESARPKVTTVEIGNEGVYYTPLSKVLVQHPSLKNGLGSAEIKNVVMSGIDIIGLDLYEPIVYDSTDANGFGMVIQCVSDIYCTPLAKAYNAGEDGLVYSIAFVTPIDALASSVVPRSGDILSYGYLDDGEFNTITNEMMITNMSQTERGYRLDLVDYNEAIYEYGEIPVYTPNITQTRITKYVPAAPPPATLDDVANAIQIVTTNGDTTWIPDTVSVVQAVASQNEIAINWEWSGSGIANTIKRFIVELTKNGGTDWQIIAEPNSNTAAYSFDRTVDGYPEADDFSTWRVRVKAENVYGIVGEYGPDDAGQAVDASRYVGWTPATPAINTRASGRGVSIGWSFASNWYGQGDVDLQIAKGYTVDAEGEIELVTDTGTLEAYAPATGVDPVLSYENYREGDPDGFLTRAGNAFFIALPLYGQNEDPISSRDTPYYIRVRSVSNQPTTAEPSGRKTSTWTTWTLVYGHASSAQDVLRAWKLDDLGEKVKIDGALGADQIYVNFLAALSSNLGVITDGALQGNENNMWALSRIYEDDGTTVRYYEGTLRVGDSNQYLRCTPVVSGGVVTSYNLEFKVGSFLVTAVGSVISGEFEVRNPAGTIARLKVDATTGATIVSGGGDVSLTAGTGRLLIGNPAAGHMAIDENEIMAKSNGTTPGTLHLNYNGGNVVCGSKILAETNKEVWHSGNDGPGSGLDADLFDGAQRTVFMEKKQVHIFDFNDITDSTLKVGETITFTTGYQPGNRPQSQNFFSGLISKQLDGFMTVFAFATAGGARPRPYIRQMNNGVWGSWAVVWHSMNDGPGSGLDADLLDGQHGSYYAPLESPALTGIPTIGGNRVAAVSAGIFSSDVNFPVGSYLSVFVGNLVKYVDRNSIYPVYLSDDTLYTYELGGFGGTVQLPGTWQACGAMGETGAGRYALFRRSF